MLRVILGHSRLAITLEIRADTDSEAQLDDAPTRYNLFSQA